LIEINACFPRPVANGRGSQYLAGFVVGGRYAADGLNGICTARNDFAGRLFFLSSAAGRNCSNLLSSRCKNDQRSANSYHVAFFTGDGQHSATDRGGQFYSRLVRQHGADRVLFPDLVANFHHPLCDFRLDSALTQIG